MDTGRRPSHTGPVGWWGARGARALGQISNVHDRLMGAANHHGMCIPGNKPARSAHVSQNLSIIKKKKK